MSRQRNWTKFLLMLLMPVILVAAGVGLVVMGFMFGSLALLLTGVGVAVAGLIWGAILLGLPNPFDMF